MKTSSKGFTLVELMLALVISTLVILAAVQTLVVNQGYFVRMTERSELLASALTARELLAQAVWKAGHSTSAQRPGTAIAVSGSAPQGHVQTGYLLDSRGTYLETTCAGNRRSRGRNITTTLDDWYPRTDGSLYCDPDSSAAASLSERIAGARFMLLQADTRQMEESTSRFVTGSNRVDNSFVRAVSAELVFVADSPPANSGQIAMPFNWSVNSSGQTPAGYSIFWRLVMPVATDRVF